MIYRLYCRNCVCTEYNIKTGTGPKRPQTRKALDKKGHTPNMPHTRRPCLQNVYLYGGFVLFLIFKVQQIF